MSSNLASAAWVSLRSSRKRCKRTPMKTLDIFATFAKFQHQLRNSSHFYVFTLVSNKRIMQTIGKKCKLSKHHQETDDDHNYPHRTLADQWRMGRIPHHRLARRRQPGHPGSAGPRAVRHGGRS